MAEGFELNGIYYAISSDYKYVTVVPGNTIYTSNWYSGNINIPASVTYEGKTYPVTGIGYGTFNACTGLTSVSMPSTITYIGSEAFRGCTALKTLVIPYGVEEIGSSAFGGCSNITSITIPNSVKTIGSYALSSCTALKEVSLSNNLTSIPDCLFGGDICLTSVDIPEGVTKIDEMAFSGCSNLVSIKLPTTLTTIGKNAFVDCFSLTSIAIPKNVSNIGDYAFNGCSSLTKAEFTSIESLCKISYGYLNSNPLSVAKHLYINGQEVTDVIIPSSVTSISNSAFKNASSIKSVTIPNNVTSIGSESFSECSELTTVSLGNNIESIGASAFYNCSALKSIIIPNGIKSIEEQTFYNCKSLTNVTIPNSVTKIGGNAFIFCTGLKSVSIGSGVSEIHDMAFGGCSDIEYFKCYATNVPRVLSEYAFYGQINLLYVPAASLNDYKTTSPWKDKFLTIKAIEESEPTAISIRNGNITLSKNGKAQLNIATQPEYATMPSVTWKSGNSSIAKVDANGLVTAVAVGTTTITATTIDNKLSATCSVKVIESSVYIETDITSQFPTDWSGWTGATGYTATQYAPMVTTNDGRRVQVCEKYNGNSADQGLVFKRVLEGMPNGTYRIELYGAAASTKGRDSYISSDMTEANEGDMTAVYLYAKTTNGTVKQYIPVHWATSFSEVATAVLNGVKVMDGTVEIGMYSDKKYTNWHVVQIKGVTALVSAEELYANALERAQAALKDATYANITGVERTALAQAIDNSTVSEQTTGAYQTAIDALDTATKTFTNTKDTYDALAAAKSMVAGYIFPYASAGKKNAAESVVTTSATSAADAENRTATILTTFRKYAESSALMEGVNGATDMTSYIRNPKAENSIVSSEWQTVFGAGSGGSIGILNNEPWTDGSGNTTHRYFDGGNWSSSSWDVSLLQEVTLPAGKYQLTVIGRSELDVSQTLIAAGKTVAMPHIGSTGGLFNRGWEQTSIEFELSQNSTVKIGVRGVTSTIHNWMSFSDFRLVRFPDSESYLRGDANGDGEIGMPDVMFVVNYILGNPAETFNEEAADANLDGEIGMPDVMFIVNYILNGKFPDEE